MDDDHKTNVRDLIKNLNDKLVLKPKDALNVKTVRFDARKISSSDDETYDELQNPTQKFSYLIKEPNKQESDTEESDSEDFTSDEENYEEYSQFGRYLNVPEIVDETKNFLREEENYCQLLADLIENYIKSIQTDKFDDVFDVFGRIDTICNFQNNTFLPELKSRRNVVEIAECFIKHKKLFSTYYEHYFNNQPNMIFIMNDSKEIFKAGRSEEECKKDENILLKTVNERIISYNNFLESMKKILVDDIDVTNFDRASAILANLTKLFSPKDGNIRFRISEIVEAERSYIEKLEKITEMIPKIGNIIKRKSRQRSIIGNLPSIHINQLNFYKDIEQCLITFDPNYVGNCFLQHKSIFMQYLKDQQMKDDPAAIEECRELLEQHSEKHFDFHAPLNHLYKYKLLLEALKKSCEKAEVPCDKVEGAFNMITGIITKMNGAAALNCIKDENLYLDEQGELLLRNEFIVIESADYEYDAMIFLFEKSLIFTEIKTEGSKHLRRDVYIYKNHIITKRLAVTVNDKSETDFQVEFHGKTKKVEHKFRAKDKNTKNAWIMALKNILMKQLEEEKQKNF